MASVPTPGVPQLVMTEKVFHHMCQALVASMACPSWAPLCRAGFPIMTLGCRVKGLHMCRAQAAFHGVPIVGIPVFGDQPDNVMKAVNRGLGLMISPGTITAASLRRAVEEVVDGRGGYAAAAAEVSIRMRAHRVSPVQKAAGE